jgi:hypothetical protein
LDMHSRNLLWAVLKMLVNIINLLKYVVL